MYRAMGYAHATAHHHATRRRNAEEGQGTIEYVGLIALIAAIMAMVATAGKGSHIAEAIVTKLKGAIEQASPTS